MCIRDSRQGAQLGVQEVHVGDGVDLVVGVLPFAGLTLDGKQISFKAPFRRLTMTDAIREKTGYDITRQSEEQLRDCLLYTSRCV